MGTVILRNSRLLRAALALGLLAVLVAGCDLFKPASPEVGGTGTTLLPSYATPESCLRYMQIGIERKDNAGQDAYLGALADTTTDGWGFHAFFDPVVLKNYSGILPADWDLRHEAQFLSVFIRSYGDPYEMRWLEDVDYPHDIYEGDNAILRRRYKVWALREKTADTLLIAVGYSELHFTRISASRWALIRWQDRVDPAVGAPPKVDDEQTFGSRRLNAGAGG
jgi:serine protease inhibitor ecotin